MPKPFPIKVLTHMVGGLSEPSKMPGYGYGLPALTSCNMGRKLAIVPGTSCHDCYACKGHYRFKNVRDAQDRRLWAVTSNPSWAKAMIALIKAKKETHFRWHDSGDIVSMDHLMKIVHVAMAVPDCKFWLPTQEHELINKYLKVHGSFPTNLCVRLSTPKIDGRPVTSPLPTSTVHKDKPAHGHVCPAPTQNNTCGACRACWEPGVKNVSYAFH